MSVVKKKKQPVKLKKLSITPDLLSKEEKIERSLNDYNIINLKVAQR